MARTAPSGVTARKRAAHREPVAHQHRAESAEEGGRDHVAEEMRLDDHPAHADHRGEDPQIGTRALARARRSRPRRESRGAVTRRHACVFVLPR